MNIHPLWYVCIITRICLILILRYLHNKKINKIYLLIPLMMGFGLLYNSIYGSNNEIQVSKVFWHEARLAHGILYIIAVYYFYINNIKMGTIILSLDIIFSIIYRIVSNK